MEINQFANIYPMLPQDELEELAADIKANGLVNPIVMKNGVLIDGRNRLAACELAGVEPTFVEYEAELDEDSIKRLILSLNNNRRHLNKGQKAMSVAMAYPEKSHGNRYSRSSENEPLDIHKGALSQARKILKYAPEEAKKVMIENKPFSEALEIAIKSELIQAELAEKRKKQQEDVAEEIRIKKEANGNANLEEELRALAVIKAEIELREARLNVIRDEYPELVEAVNNGIYTLEKAEAKVSDAKETNRVLQLSVKSSFGKLIDFSNNNKHSPQMVNLMHKYYAETSDEERTLIKESCDLITKIIYKYGELK